MVKVIEIVFSWTTKAQNWTAHQLIFRGLTWHKRTGARRAMSTQIQVADSHFDVVCFLEMSLRTGSPTDLCLPLAACMLAGLNHSERFTRLLWLSVTTVYRNEFHTVEILARNAHKFPGNSLKLARGSFQQFCMKYRSKKHPPCSLSSLAEKKQERIPFAHAAFHLLHQCTCTHDVKCSQMRIFLPRLTAPSDTFQSFSKQRKHIDVNTINTTKSVDLVFASRMRIVWPALPSFINLWSSYKQIQRKDNVRISAFWFCVASMVHVWPAREVQTPYRSVLMGKGTAHDPPPRKKQSFKLKQKLWRMIRAWQSGACLLFADRRPVGKETLSPLPTMSQTVQSQTPRSNEIWWWWWRRGCVKDGSQNRTLLTLEYSSVRPDFWIELRISYLADAAVTVKCTPNFPSSPHKANSVSSSKPQERNDFKSSTVYCLHKRSTKLTELLLGQHHRTHFLLSANTT